MFSKTSFSLLLLHFLINSGLASISPFFPLVAEAQDLSLILIGTATASFALGGLLISLVSSSFEETVYSQTMFFYSGLLTALSIILLCVLPYQELLAFALTAHVLRFIEGLSSTLLSSCILVNLTNSSRNEAETATTVQQMFSTFSAIIGPGLGSLLYYFGGFSFVFSVFGGGTVLLLPLTLCSLKKNQLQEVAKPRPSICPLLKSWSVLVLALVLLVSTAILSSLDVFLALHLQTFDLNTSIGALFFSIPPLALGVSLVIVELLSPYANKRLLIGLGLLLQAIGVFIITPIYYFASTLSTTGIGLALIGVGIGFCTTPALSLISSSSHSFFEQKDVLNATASLYVLVLFLGEIFGTL